MDVDSKYLTLFISSNLNLAQGDEDTLNQVLFALSNQVDPSVQPADIKKLKMVDLRPLLAKGKYAEVARTVVKRISASQVVHSVSESGHTAVRDAFTGTYLGRIDVVRMAVDQVINDSGLYANAIPFVQSSGTGKSRLMVELGREIFVLVVNLREDDPAGSFSFPQPDPVVRQYLLFLQRGSTDEITVAEHWRLRYAAFLCSVFDVLATILQEGHTPSAFARRFQNQKPFFLSSIIEKSIKREEEFLSLYKHRDGKAKICSQITKKDLIASATNFFQTLRNLDHSPRPPPLVLALDEAHVMTKREGSLVTGSLLDIFCSVLADLKESSNWTKIIHFATIFLSTNSQLNGVAPSTGQIVSERSYHTRLAGVLTCVPFDVFVDEPRSWTVAEISELKFLSNFGRPLFGALIKAGLDPINALALAQEKLAHARRPFTIGTLMSVPTAFALLSRRILLNFRPLQSSTATMTSNLVACHLQIAFVVPTHRRFIVSGSPSEPFLVEAAARMMATPGFSAIGCLLDFTNAELLDAGESGEIVGRLLTIDAYDRALRQRTPSNPIYHSWVSVMGYLKAFFTDAIYKRIKDLRPYHNPAGPRLEVAFKNAVIRLTHYVRLSQVDLVDATNVRKAFLRGMGIVGAQSQELIDTVIPMLFVDLRKDPSTWVVEKKKMSQIMVNIQNEAIGATSSHSDPYKSYPDLNTDLPTILLWHQFGSKKDTIFLPSTSNDGNKQSTKGDVYFIDVYGIGPSVYRAITPANQAQYQRVVGCADMYRDAPYTFTEYITSVECTLPKWSTDSFQQTAG